MRKILRAKLRHQAEKASGKTIKLFRGMWKQYKAKRQPVVDTGTKAKPKKKRSMLHRAVRKILKRK